jgi:hypothetical protein
VAARGFSGLAPDESLVQQPPLRQPAMKRREAQQLYDEGSSASSAQGPWRRAVLGSVQDEGSPRMALRRAQQQSRGAANSGHERQGPPGSADPAPTQWHTAAPLRTLVDAPHHATASRNLLSTVPCPFVRHVASPRCASRPPTQLSFRTYGVRKNEMVSGVLPLDTHTHVAGVLCSAAAWDSGVIAFLILVKLTITTFQSTRL